MKAEILKIAGVKSENEFYRKYPTEEAFMKAHGKEFKKAKLSKAMPEAQDGWVERAANAEFSCGAHPRSELRQSYTERSNPSSQMDKEEFKQLKNEYKASPYKDSVNINEYFIAKQMAENRNRKMTREDKAYSKFFDPNTGATLPSAGTSLNQEGSLISVNRMFPGTNILTPGDVLQGIKKDYNITTPMKKKEMKEIMEKADKIGFQKPKAKKGRQVNKFEQLTDFGNPPQAPYGMYIPGQGVPQNLQNPYAQQTSYVPGQGATGIQNYVPTGTGLPSISTYNPQGMFNLGSSGTTQLQNNFLSLGNSKTGIGTAAGKGSGFMNAIGGTQGLSNIAGSIIGGIQEMGSYKKKKKDLQTQIDVAKVVNRAAKLPEERTKRYYTRPEDLAFEPNQLFPTYGVGTNYLSKNGSVVKAQTGKVMGGNPTEIQNTYNPGDLYSNLGFEPLGESDIVKQYEEGGFIPMAQEGYSSADSLSSFLGAFGGGGAGGAGKAGTIGGMIAPALGFANFAIGDIHKRNLSSMADQANQLANSTAMMNIGKGIHSQYSKFMEDGGWVSNDWQPQVITKFGEHDVKDLLTEDPMMDTLRTGGHITQNNIYPQDQYALGGNLKTTWGGYAEPISHNPYLPGTGQTVMFRGKSHEESDGRGHTGIGVKYGEGGKMTDYAEYGTKHADADVEVERGEPAIELPDTESQESSSKYDMGGNLNKDQLSMNVYGDLVMNSDVADYIGRPDAKGMKYKNFVGKVLAKEENKQNKTLQKASNLIELHDDGTPFGQLAMNSAKALDLGANMNLKNIADTKIKAAEKQTETNKAADIFGFDAAALAKGKVKIDKEAMKGQAKYGKEIFKAQTGDKYKVKGVQPGSIDYNPIGEAGNEDLWGSKEKYSKNWIPKVGEALSDPERAKQIIAELESYKGQDAKDVIDAIKKQKTISGKIAKIQELGTDQKVGPYHNILNQVIDKTTPPAQTTSTFTTNPYIAKQVIQQQQPQIQQQTKKKGFDLLGFANSILPYFNKPYQEDFDISQIYPELAAIAMNKVEPVKAQGIQPLLETPYDISYQDRINEVTASERAAQRMAGQNPAAAAMIFGKAKEAKDSILAEQFRENQAMKAGVYGRNRAVLNDFMKTNQAMYADQEAKQRLAEEKSKYTFLEALGSMTDKKAKQKLENRTFAAYSNMFPNYRFTGDMKALPAGLTLFNPPVVSGASSTGTTPSLATNPYVSGDRAAVVSNSATTKAVDPFSQVPLMPGVTVTSSRSLPNYSDIPTLDDIYKEESVYPQQQKYGGKTKKKKTNGSIVKAIKNI